VFLVWRLFWRIECGACVDCKQYCLLGVFSVVCDMCAGGSMFSCALHAS
jgi:hypothetical protein